MTATFRLAVVSSVVLIDASRAPAPLPQKHNRLPFASSICSTPSEFKGQSNRRQPYGRRSGGSTGRPLPPTAKFAATRGWEPGPGIAVSPSRTVS